MQFYYFLKALFLSPTLFILFIAFGYLFYYFSRFKRFSKGVIATSLVCLLFSNGWMAEFLISSLEDIPPLKQAEFDSIREAYAKNKSVAIVTLGGGKAYKQPEYGEDGVTRDAIPRLLYTIWLQKRLDLPLLVSGGIAVKREKPESAMMANFVNEFGGHVTWRESESINTWENATNSVKLLKEKGIKTVVLVTSAYHMRRALYCFEQQGIEVIPAPTDFSLTRIPLQEPVQKSLPTIDSFRLIRISLHEYLGLFAYRWNLRVSGVDFEELKMSDIKNEMVQKRKKRGVVSEDYIFQY